MEESIWLRLGDNAEYVSFPNIHSIVEEFNSYSLINIRVKSFVVYGFTTEGFEGNNYISCYWGDSEAQPIRELSKSDKRIIMER